MNNAWSSLQEHYLLLPSLSTDANDTTVKGDNTNTEPNICKTSRSAPGLQEGVVMNGMFKGANTLVSFKPVQNSTGRLVVSHALTHLFLFSVSVDTFLISTPVRCHDTHQSQSPTSQHMYKRISSFLLIFVFDVLLYFPRSAFPFFFNFSSAPLYFFTSWLFDF